MNKAELVAATAELTGKSQIETSNTLEALIKIIIGQVSGKNEVQVSGLCKFDSRTVSGLIPGTDKKYTSVVPTFKAAKAFKDAVKKA